MTGYTAERIDNNRIKLSGAPDPDERESALVQMLWALDEVDCYSFGEGAEYGAQILEGHEPEEWEREEIARDVYGEPMEEVFSA